MSRSTRWWLVARWASVWTQPCRDTGKRAARSAQLMTRYFCIWSSLYNGRRLAAHAVYLPPGNHPVDRHAAFQAAEVCSEQCVRSAQHVWGGDWNSHLGREFLSPHTGQYRMRQESSRHAQQFPEILEHTGLGVADTLVPARRRATWLHPASQNWHE